MVYFLAVLSIKDMLEVMCRWRVSINKSSVGRLTTYVDSNEGHMKNKMYRKMIAFKALPPRIPHYQTFHIVLANISAIYVHNGVIALPHARCNSILAFPGHFLTEVLPHQLTATGNALFLQGIGNGLLSCRKKRITYRE